MIVTPSFSREMGEGGRLVGAGVGPRVPTLGLPDPNPAYKTDIGGGVYKTGGLPGFDHNKNSSASPSYWLLPPPLPGPRRRQPLPSGLSPPHPHRPYPHLDPRPPLERPTPVSGAASLVRPLGPPPLRGLLTDPRDLREGPPYQASAPSPLTSLSPSSPSLPPDPTPSPPPPRCPAPQAGGSPVVAVTASDPGASSPAKRPPSGSGSPIITTTPTLTPSVTVTTTTTSVPPNHKLQPPLLSPSPPKDPPRPSSPYHAHFARGALVTVGAGVRRVEELQTRDFLEAAKAAEDLMLDPSTVAAITSTTPPAPPRATITFTFPSRKHSAVQHDDPHQAGSTLVCHRCTRGPAEITPASGSSPCPHHLPYSMSKATRHHK
ncbi:hypothetical protein Pcinc_038504 [Petrolisthes cinctipes]|uniref:AXH domain-containing protein n=1 Tax=Petrolisthes cinctipes TaxID=88211 RepID=A0AAE1BQE1_PETCI|nr:hypothetical protein Pcinc_038504 [Petrolisthes cinctipes]